VEDVAILKISGHTMHSEHLREKPEEAEDE
jgi:hypothetical protein